MYVDLGTRTALVPDKAAWLGRRDRRGRVFGCAGRLPLSRESATPTVTVAGGDLHLLRPAAIWCNITALR